MSARVNKALASLLDSIRLFIVIPIGILLISSALKAIIVAGFMVVQLAAMVLG